MVKHRDERLVVQPIPEYPVSFGEYRIEGGGGAHPPTSLHPARRGPHASSAHELARH